MHHHLEIIMPPTKNVKAAVEKILMPFCENQDDIPEEDRTHHAFWDWFVIGGRWSGAKLTAKFDQKQLAKFYEALNEAKITVSSFKAGKDELNPKSQISVVNKLWQEHFPEIGGTCPLFNHFNNQYEHSTGEPDIALLKNVHPNLKAGHVIIADGKGEATFMIQDSVWNGVNFADIKWDGKVSSALKMFLKKTKYYNEKYAKTATPKDNWLCVTVDYHS